MDNAILRHLAAGSEIADLTWEAPDELTVGHAQVFLATMRAYHAGDSEHVGRLWENLLIGVGAGIVGVLAVHGAPTALQGALTGAGFTGVGLVFRQQQGHLQMIRGLTTAAALCSCSRRRCRG